MVGAVDRRESMVMECELNSILQIALTVFLFVSSLVLVVLGVVLLRELLP